MSQMFIPAAEPKTELGRYRVLGPNAGIRVSPLQLGAMSIGDAWYVLSTFSIPSSWHTEWRMASASVGHDGRDGMHSSSFCYPSAFAY